MKKSKIVSLALAGALTVTALLAGTYAWTSISQVATNEVIDEVNPGGRLHDDFDGTNKDIYVENFTSEEEDGATIYARIKLTEYLEMGTGAGQLDSEGKAAKPLVDGTSITDKTKWTIYKYNNKNDEFRNYFEWTMGGETSYMPTFNKNKDSLEADINGTLEGPDGKRLDTDDAYKDYVDYTKVTSVKGIEIYDVDSDTVDEIPLSTYLNTKALVQSVEADQKGTLKADVDTNTDGMEELNLYEETTGDDGADIKVVGTLDGTTDTTHTVQKTKNATIMSMAEWIAKGCIPGEYWVYDTDGWAYWAKGIEPGTATGCLLNKIERKSSFVSEYYYAINVTAQFATAGDWGDADDKTGFYKDGETVSDDALYLLNTIAGEEKNIILTAEEPEAGVTPEAPLQLSAKVMLGTATLDEAVTWSIEGNVSNETKISDTGVLTIGKDESAEYIVVTATLDNNTEIADIYTVKVGSWYEMKVTTEDGTNYAVQGKTKTFTAAVMDQRGKSVTNVVAWELAGTYEAGTSIDDSGVLTVAEAKDSTITVTATCAEYGNIVGTHKVNVITQLEYVEYMEVGTLETVTIDNIEWYVLKKGGSEKEALLWAAKAYGILKDAETGSETVVESTVDGSEGMAFDDDSSNWKESEMRGYLNGDFLNSLTVLNEVAVPTTITTRKGIDSDEFDESTDTIFLFSEADLLGFFDGTTDKVKVGDYTIKETNDDGELVGVSVLSGDSKTQSMQRQSEEMYWLRSLRKNAFSLAHGNTNGWTSSASYNHSGLYLRPALWIDLNKL